MHTYKISETEKVISLEFHTPDEASEPIDYAHYALDAVFDLAEGLFAPLKVDLSVNFNDEHEYPVSNEYPARPFWMLRQKEIPQKVAIKEHWGNEEVSLTDTINKETTLEWLKQAIASNQPNTANDYTLGWRQFIFKTNRCYLSISHENLENNCITAKDNLNAYQFPVEFKNEEIWISGPIARKTMYAPIEVIVSNTMGTIDISILLYWSVYTSPGGAGLNLVRQATEKLINKGWEVKQDSLPK